MPPNVTRPALRYHGGKFRLAPWIMQFFPPHTCYVEPFGGAAGVLLQKPRAYAEVYNDLDSDISNFFRVVRNPEQCSQLITALALTPYARDEFDMAWEPTDNCIERARRTAVRAQMGFGSAGATKDRTGFRIDTKRAYGTAQQLWAEYPASVSAVCQRLQGVLIENRPAIDVMQQHDGAETLHFIDPPYVHGTRVLQSGNGSYYRHEMTDDDHLELLASIKTLRGMVIISGYDSALYHEALAGWQTHSTNSRIAANRGAGIRREVVWINPACSQALLRNRVQRDLLETPLEEWASA